MLKPFGAEIWIADGPDVAAALGFHYPTRTVVIRLSDGTLFIHSPSALNEGLRAALDALGEVRHLVAPNSLHHLFIADWKRAFPAAQTYAAPGLQQKRRDFIFDRLLGRAPVSEWSSEIEHVVLEGNVITTEIVFFHQASSTVIFTDIIQQFPARWFTGWRALLARWDLMLGAEPAVPRKFRLAFTDRRATRAGVERIRAWPALNVLMAHGTPVTQDAPAFLRRAFKWLMP
ncbi:MAG: DUF4336 domain-containing protein [Pseudorhodoplanes sp.]